MAIARERGYRSIAFPLIGAGSGGCAPAAALELMRDELGRIEYDGETIWERVRDGGFPDVKALKQRVRDRLEPGRDLGHIDR